VQEEIRVNTLESINLSEVTFKKVPFNDVVIATTLKDLRIARRYMPNLFGDIVQIVIRILFFLLFSNFAVYTGPTTLTGNELFIFFLGAILLWVFSNTALTAPLNSVTSDLYNGTLEYLYSNPISRYAYYMGTVCAKAITNLAIFIPAFIFMIFYSGASFADTVNVLLVCLTALITLIAMGIMISLLGLLWRQVGSIVGVLFLFFEFLAGAYFPVEQFPKVLRYFAYALPHTWGYDLIRYYSLKNNWDTLESVLVEWIILGAFALIYTIASLILLSKVEKLSKKQGLNLI
jgi:ABC-2 type transport system permease protein